MKELKILNPSQVYFYIENGVNPVRVECGYNDRVVFIFEQEKTKDIYAKWIEKSKWKIGV